MSQFTVAKSRTHILKNGQPFFYLADTAWMAFGSMEEWEWDEYLRIRKSQGFNVLQISILPVTHDTSVGPEVVDPFLQDTSGNWDFTRLNPDYFEKAERMVARAVDQGLAVCLGVLWCSYVPGTRCSAKSPVASAMPLEAVAPYAKAVAQRFGPYDPLFFISGDTYFESEDEAPYYMTALETVREVCPDALLTMHLTPTGELDRSFQEAVDFYMYQSGHGDAKQDNPYLLARKFCNYEVRHPVVNGEPCYEGHGRVGTGRRFSARDVRKAVWQSLLSGASMGVTYGGHGVWSFHRPGMRFLNADRSREPYHWRDALDLQGAWDTGFARWLCEDQSLIGAEPADVLRNTDPEIVAAEARDRGAIVVYAPDSVELELSADLSAYQCVLVDLSRRRFVSPILTIGEVTRVGLPPFAGDFLFLARRLRNGD